MMLDQSPRNNPVAQPRPDQMLETCFSNNHTLALKFYALPIINKTGSNFVVFEKEEFGYTSE